ncbi:MAG: hypothetical protein WC506_01825 [Candidatus Micrarchaeia archaeon]
MSNAQKDFKSNTVSGSPANNRLKIFRIGRNGQPATTGLAAHLGISRARMLFIGISLATSVTCFTILGVRHHLQVQQEKANMIDSISMSLSSQHRISGLSYDDVAQAVQASYDFDLSHKDVLLLLEMKQKLADVPYFFKSKPTIEMILETLRRNTEWIERPGHGSDYGTWFGKRAEGYRESGFDGEADRIERIRCILYEFNSNASDDFKNRIVGNAIADGE